MKRQIWKLLWLLTSLMVGCAAKCMDVSRTVALQLSRTQVLRTWQPDGAGCRWWENRISSETDQFPAAVRSGPRWLVMQLRQPMMMEVVSVRGWDGQWQAAAPVGSPVSAVGASSLPLELQLEDPCRASWEAFNSSDRWRQLGMSDLNSETLVSFILLKNNTGGLQWMSLHLTGRPACVQLLTGIGSPFCMELDKMANSPPGDPICFSVLDCGLKTGHSNVNCSIKKLNGRVSQLNSIRSDAARCQHEFEFTSSLEHQGAVLSCAQDSHKAERVERMLLMRIGPRTSVISPPAVWVVGRTASVSFITTESSPEPRHLCWLELQNQSEASSHGSRILSVSSIHRRVVRNSGNQPVFTVKSKFAFAVTADMKFKQIQCTETFGSAYGVTTHVQRVSISHISEPCETVIDFGQDLFWREGELRSMWVKSKRCSYWPVTHSCRLIDLAMNASTELNKTNKTNKFNSEHQLQASRWMAQRHWLVRCRVNQSGVEYPDVETNAAEMPAVFYKGSLNIFSPRVDWNGISVQVNSTDARPHVSNISCRAQFGESNILKSMKQAKSHCFELPRSELPAFLGVNLGVAILCSGQQTFYGITIYNISESESFTLTGARETSTRAGVFSNGSHGVVIFGVVTLLICLLILGAVSVYLRVATARESYSCFGDFQLQDVGAGRFMQLDRSNTESEQQCSCYTQLSRVTQQTNSEPHCMFVKVLEMSFLPDPDSANSSSEDSDNDSLMYTEPSGHHELDGCTFVQYNEHRHKGYSS